ncbi:hypothetical protein A7985_06580 [Pseudoalteromonas luteoviolacea]|uniref:DUF4397 domain-containing protein n=1 Tax=Pseudoalteromonas luteoviolacea TaxID=43657 RepID=A0A1C0TWI1_9GAMM|nr:DUF4397 domain-containing protein [Pseudoalteromonas luteoviolacea]MBQ4810129.1 DUF4397 domain-containing protein [Pseudoalteromonas luteoviolacea]OCQ23604.1 hypothetical protein A7985_06580 [Pseudoalteromonas luteoviolacea]
MNLVKGLVLTVMVGVMAGCNNDDTYTADVSAINLVNGEVDVYWQFEKGHEEMSLTDKSGLLFGEKSDEKMLVQDDSDGNVFAFYGVKGNSLETAIESTRFRFSEHADYVVYTFGRLDNDSAQAAQLGAVKINDDEIASSKYRVIIFHTYVADMGKIDVYVGDEKVAENLEYGDTTNYLDLPIERNELIVVKAGQGANTQNPIAKATLSPQAGDIQLAYITSTSENEGNIKSYKVNAAQ